MNYDEFWNKLNEEFHFTIDVAASKENARCKKFYDRRKDGLKQSWKGEVVWCNPTYTYKYGEWLNKVISEIGKAKKIVFMMGSSDGSRKADHKGNLIYCDPEGNEIYTARELNRFLDAAVEIRYYRREIESTIDGYDIPCPSIILVFE